MRVIMYAAGEGREKTSLVPNYSMLETYGCGYARNRYILGHGHVLEVWILISSGSDIIIKI